MSPKIHQEILPLYVTDNLVIKELKDETLVYNLKTNKVYCLSRTTALVWQLCDGTKSVGEISQLLSKKLNSTAGEDLIWLALKQLQKEKLIVDNDEITARFRGMTRREVIRRVGLTTMLALPLISAVAAPTAAHASSGKITCLVPGGLPCVVAANCPFQAGFSVTCITNCCVYVSNNVCVGLGQPCTTPGALPCCAPFVCEECFTGTCQPDPGGIGGCI